jgi:hypothetical protein
MMRLCLLVALASLGFPAMAQYKMQTPAGEAPGFWHFGTIGLGKGADGKPLITVAKGLAVRLGEDGEAGICYDLELCRVAGVWTGGKFVTPVNLMSRGEYPTAIANEVFTGEEIPGFFLQKHDRDVLQKEQQTSISALIPSDFPQREAPQGLLPAGTARYKGMHVHAGRVFLHWEVGGVEIVETPVTSASGGARKFARVIEIGPSEKDVLIASAISVDELTTDPRTSTLPREFPIRKSRSSNAAFAHRFMWEPVSMERCSPGTDRWEQELPALRRNNPELAIMIASLIDEKKANSERWMNAAFAKFGKTVFLRVPPAIAKSTHILTTTVADPKFSERTTSINEAVYEDMGGFTKGGPGIVGQPSRIRGRISGEEREPYAVDTIPLPEPNPWKSPMFIGGFDFFPDGRAAVCTFHGDVFIVSGIDEKLENVTWQRFASGLFHPLGLRIVNGEIYVTERSGITRLKDLNDDGEADLYEPLNWDVHVTKSFHEFAFDLQTDQEGNFYFAKAGPVKNGGRGFDEIAAHHGTVMRVSPDGQKLEVIATGLRAPNGLGIGPRGELTSGDNEGTWTPACKINWIKPGGFYGVVDLAHRTPPPTAYDPPLCWLPKRVDNSGGSQVWVPDDGRWGPWSGQLLHLSYGHAALFGVMHEQVESQKRRIESTVQGGVVRFPLKFDSGIMRARFNPIDGQLYVAGLRGWQTDGAKNGCFQRVRHTGAVVRMPIELHAKKNGIELRFTSALDTQSAADPDNWNVEVWNYVWSRAYGSPEVSTLALPQKPAESGNDGVAQYTREQMGRSKHDPLTIKSVSIGTDDRSVFLEIPEIKPVMQMSIRYAIKSADGADIRGEIVNTIHVLSEE